MPPDVIAWTESQDSAVLIEIAAALGESHLNSSGDDIYAPGFAPMLAGYWFGGANFTQGRIQAPTLLKKMLIDVEPADLADEPASPPALHWFGDDPIPLKVDDAIRCFMAEDNAAASRVTAVLLLVDAPISRIRGPFYSARFVGATTLAANVWTNGSITSSQTLPNEEFVVGGMRAQAAGLRAFRFYFTEQGPRPGALGCDLDGDLNHDVMRRGGMGDLGHFTPRTIPTVDYLSASADTSEVLHLDLIVPG